MAKILYENALSSKFSPDFFWNNLWGDIMMLQYSYVCTYLCLKKLNMTAISMTRIKKKIGFLWPDVLLANVPPSQMTSAAAVKGNQKKVGDVGVC